MWINRAWLAVAAIAVSACTGHKTSESQRISDDFELCANLPEGSFYRLQHRSYDFEIGHMTLAGEKLEVYIGYQPPFDGDPWPRGKEVTDGFVVVGKERAGDVERLLLGNKRQVTRGPLFVMFFAPDLRSAEHLLTERDLIVDCQ